MLNRPIDQGDISYPRDILQALLLGRSPYAFYLFQWVDYKKDAMGYRLKLNHDIKLFDGTIIEGCYPNATAWHGKVRVSDDDVEFIRISKKQLGYEFEDPRLKEGAALPLDIQDQGSSAAEAIDAGDSGHVEAIIKWLKERGLYDDIDYQHEGPDFPEILSSHESELMAQEDRHKQHILALEALVQKKDDALQFYAEQNNWISIESGPGGVKMAAIVSGDRMPDYENNAGHFLAKGGKIAAEALALTIKDMHPLVVSQEKV